MKYNYLQSISEEMIKNNISFASVIDSRLENDKMYERKHIVLELTDNDKELISYIEKNNTPPNRLLTEASRILELPVAVLRKICSGKSLSIAIKHIIKTEARKGTKEEKDRRINDLKEYVEQNHLPFIPRAYSVNTIPSLNSVLPSPDNSALERITEYMDICRISKEQLTWLLYDISFAENTHDRCVGIFLRKEIFELTEEKYKFNVTLTTGKSNIINCCAKEKEISININDEQSPLELYRSGIIQELKKELDSAYKVIGFAGGLSEFLENKSKIKNQKASIKKFRKVKNKDGIYAACCELYSKETIANDLSLMNRYAKNRKLVPNFLKNKIYSFKKDILLGALNHNDATITKLVKRPNPFMVKREDLVDGESMHSLLLKIAEIDIHKEYKELHQLISRLEIENSSPSEKICKMEEQIQQFADSEFSENLWLLLHKTSLALMFLKGFQYIEGRSYHQDMVAKRFSSEYTHVWDINFNGCEFHLPANKINLDKDKYQTEEMKWQFFVGTPLSEHEIIEFPISQLVDKYQL